MPTNKSIFILCDKILNLANLTPDRTNHKRSLNLPEEYNVVMIDMALAQLEKDNYIIRGTNNTDYFNITALGQTFISNNGYEGQFTKEQKRDAYTDQLQTSTLATNASVQDTNRLTEKNYAIQKKLTCASIAVSVTAALIAAIALFRDTEGEMRNQNKILEKQRQTIDSIWQDLKVLKPFRDTAIK